MAVRVVVRRSNARAVRSARAGTNGRKLDMPWLYIILISYLILSISNLIDKIFLSKIVTQSIVYAIWVSILSIVVVILLAIDVGLNQAAGGHASLFGELTWMDPWFVMVSFFLGILFTLAIYLLYSALQRGEASRVIPLIGGSMPLLIYAMTFYYDPLDRKKLIAFVFLVAGTVLISLTPRDSRKKNKTRAVSLAIGASLSFALYFVLTQYLFRQQGFVNGLVWPRLGSAFVVLLLFFNKHIRTMMVQSLQPLSRKMRGTWLANQALGALGFVGQQYVISIPGVSVALISALQSMQYVFILLFASSLSFFKPQLLREYISPAIIVQKLLALAFIAVGLYFVSV
ncbi:MAG: hypothetical protein HY422_00970 [Candidatus Komeilibacteria bacterium]|nr:hypothetical protein [Candidatus Komeilibacteria bacterium]